MRRLAFLTPMIIAGFLQAAPAQDAAKPEEAKARPKITQDDINDLKLAHYEVERTEVKFQSYIITYEGEELNQLEYDTRKEAQARVDEINDWDRLDKLSVEGKQNKMVGIREIKRTTTEWVSGDVLAMVAKKLGAEQKARYKPSGKTTHCNEFVRDFATELLGRDVPELRGRVGEQADQLKASAEMPDSKWRSLSFPDDPQAAFQTAQALANEGKLVVVIWKNPKPTGTDTGHVAVVVPSPEEDGGLFDATKRKWGMRVPYIAQAGETVSDLMPLGHGFGPAKKVGMEVYVLSA